MLIGIISGQVEVQVSMYDPTPGLPLLLNRYMTLGKSASLSFSAWLWPQETDLWALCLPDSLDDQLLAGLWPVWAPERDQKAGHSFP